MKNLKCFWLVVLMIGFYNSHAQGADSLSIEPVLFYHKTTISFYLEKADTVDLIFANVVGEIKKTFYKDTFFESGKYTVELNGDSLTEGIYLILFRLKSRKGIIKRLAKSNTVTDVVSSSVEKNSYLLFPNPTKDVLNIPIEGFKTITITDIEGKMIKTFKTDQKIISLQDLVEGHYIFTVLSAKNEILTSQKIIKK